MDRKKLLIDFDDVICEGTILTEVNKFLGTNYEISDVKDYDVISLIPKDRQEEFSKKIANIHLYDNAKLIKGAKAALEKLNKKYDIYVCSSCILLLYPLVSGPLFASKFNFLIRELPFLDPRKFIFTSSKDVVIGDIFIDDYFGNLEKSTVKTKLLFSSYHNKHFTQEELDEKGIIVVDGWEDICNKLV